MSALTVRWFVLFCLTLSCALFIFCSNSIWTFFVAFVDFFYVLLLLALLQLLNLCVVYFGSLVAGSQSVGRRPGASYGVKQEHSTILLLPYSPPPSQYSFKHCEKCHIQGPTDKCLIKIGSTTGGSELVPNFHWYTYTRGRQTVETVDFILNLLRRR